MANCGAFPVTITGATLRMRNTIIAFKWKQ